MIKRLTVLYVLLFLFVSFVCAKHYTIDGTIANSGIANHIYFSIVPYNGATGIDMRSQNYPQYDVNNASGFGWSSGSLKNLNRNSTSVYVNDNIVAGVGIYNITRWFKSSSGDTYVMAKKTNPISIKVTADCSSGFNFVSQSNPSIVRPFTLFTFPRYAVSTNIDGYKTEGVGDNKNVDDDHLISFTPPYNNVYEKNFQYGSELDLSSTKFWNEEAPGILSLWFDIFCSLPLDENGVSQSGVTIGGKEYPLVDANDYTALVTFTVELTLTYECTSDSSKENFVFHEIQSLPVPFSGYSDAMGTSGASDSAAIYINTTTANINLNRAYTSRWVDIGSINYIQNFDRGTSCSDGTPKSRIFFSASADPTVQNTNGFRFIHKNAGNVLTSNNSVPFTLRFTGTGDSYSVGDVEFDGKGYTTSTSLMNSIEGNYVTSYCNNTGTFNHVDNLKSHFHTIDGDLSIMVEDNSDTMQAGTYYADIYVHIITVE